MSYEQTLKRYQLEQDEKWRDLLPQIPTLKFKPEYEVKIIPPFGGAIARFLISIEGQHICSVYLDFYDRLGIYGEPYYEIYPSSDRDIARFNLRETDLLMQEIEKVIETKAYLD